MRNDDPKPFDFEANEAADITHQFWGGTRGWSEPGADAADDAMWADRTPRSLQAITASLTGIRPRRSTASSRRTDVTGRVDRTRSHGIVRPAPVEELERARREATLAELAAGWLDDEDWPAGDPTPGNAPTERVAPVRADRRPAADRRDDRQHPAGSRFENDRFGGHDVAEFDEDAELVPLSPVAPLASKLGLGAVDPLLARLGSIVAIGILVIPLALSARGGGADDAVAAESATPPAAAAADTASTAGAAASSEGSPAASTTAADTQSASAATATAAAVSGAVDESTAVADAPAAAAEAGTSAPTPTTSEAVADDQSQSPPTDPVDVATVDQQAERLEPNCSMTYEAGVGDSWYRIADAAGVSPNKVMDANLAGLDTPIFPGDEICLPDGATMPEQPTTTTEAPATTQPATTQPPATTAPSTTVKSTTTTAAPPPAPVSTAAVQELIREIWPDDLEEKALQIAWRESNYKADAFNGSCCYGVFQMHWGAHKSWLDDYGINTSSDLFDARKNITAAYALYQRSGGWGPWGG